MSFKKFLLFAFSFIISLVFSVGIFAANFTYTFTDEEWNEISKDILLEEKEFDSEFRFGPGYEMLKEKYNTDDFKTILDSEDKTYGFEEENVKTVIAPKDVKSGTTSDNYKLSKRDKRINRMVEAEQKKAEKDENKNEKSNKGSKKVRISVVVDKSHPNNPNLGQTYTNTHTIYTDAETLGDAMREAEITSDFSFATTIDGINGSVTVSETYSDDYMHGTWEGWSWMLYENGKKTSVGMEDLPIKDGTMVRWKAEFQTMSW